MSSIQIVIHCRFCQKTFRLAATLLQHQANHHDPTRKPRPRKYKCNLCKKVFATGSNLQSHSRTHTGERPFSCPEPGCGRTFSQAGHCTDHFKTHQETKLGTLFPCAMCPKICRSRKILSHHRSNVHRLAPHLQPRACYFCKCVYARHSALISHFRLHTKEKPFKCYFCPKRVAADASLRTHVQRHTKERPHRCSGCGVWYKHQATLGRHAQIPETCGKMKNLKTIKKTWGKFIKCIICHQNFPSRPRHPFELHIRSHTGERPFLCSHLDCGQSFMNQNSLTIHIREHHKDDQDQKMFPCSMCSKVFPTLSKLYDHRSYHHYKPAHLKPKNCYFCGYLACNSSNLVVHLRHHIREMAYRCSEPCGRKFVDSNDLLTHKKLCRYNY